MSFFTTLFAATLAVGAPPIETNAQPPKTLVMRVSPDGQVSVAPFNDSLAPSADLNVLAQAQFREVEPEKMYPETAFSELDADAGAGRASWYFYHRPVIVRPRHAYPVYRYPYYPIYYYGGYQFYYYPYFSFNYGGYFYYYFRW